MAYDAEGELAEEILEVDYCSSIGYESWEEVVRHFWVEDIVDEVTQ